MDADRFDALLAALIAVPTRRDAVRVLAGLSLAGTFAQADAKKKKRKKKCAKAGKKTSKKRKKCCKGLVKDTTGRCARRCTPVSCPASSCGALPDECGGMLHCGGCPTNQICLLSNVCQPCTVACTGTPTECGSALQQAFEAGGPQFVCPGRYRGGFTPSDAVTLIGAGEGDDPAKDTILDGGGAERVLTIPGGAAPVTLERLRVTDGRVFNNGTQTIRGGAILHEGSTLRMTECTVDKNFLPNVVPGAFAFGAGIAVDPSSTLELTRCTVRDNHITGGISGSGGGISTAGTTTLTDCLIEDNTAQSFGGGIYVDSGTTTLAGSTQVRRNEAFSGGGIYIDEGTLEIAESCRVTQNNSPGNFGGIVNQAGTVTLVGANPSPIVVENCHENCGGPGGVPKCSTAPPISCPP